jgi:hypothetical protein
MARIKTLDSEVDGLWARAIEFQASSYLAQLRDCFPFQAATTIHVQQHAAMGADAGKQRITSTRPILKPTAEPGFRAQTYVGSSRFQTFKR